MTDQFSFMSEPLRKWLAVATLIGVRQGVKNSHQPNHWIEANDSIPFPPFPAGWQLRGFEWDEHFIDAVKVQEPTGLNLDISGRPGFDRYLRSTHIRIAEVGSTLGITFVMKDAIVIQRLIYQAGGFLPRSGRKLIEGETLGYCHRGTTRIIDLDKWLWAAEAMFTAMDAHVRIRPEGGA